MIYMVTERLIIRDYMEEDTEAAHNLFSNPEIMYFTPESKTDNLFETKKVIFEAMMQAQLENRTKYYFAILLKDTETFIGEIGLTVAAEAPEGKVVNLGYYLHKDYWGKGYITEACVEVLDFAFQDIHVYKVSAGCLQDNKGSEKIMQKIGMIQEGHFVQHILFDGKLRDRVDYRLLKQEWEALVKKNS